MVFYLKSYKAKTITEIEKVTDPTNERQLNMVEETKGSINLSVGIDQNIYIFDSDKDVAENVYKIPKDIPPSESAYGSSPCILINDKLVRIVVSGNISEVILHPYSYVGVVDESLMRTVKSDSFGKALTSEPKSLPKKKKSNKYTLYS